mgnify:CR=1 FL=1
MDRRNLRELAPFERAPYDKQRSERVSRRVPDLDGILILDDRHQFHYDKLLIAGGSVPNKPANPWRRTRAYRRPPSPPWLGDGN